MYGSLKNPVTLVEVEAWVREENSTGVLPSQSDDIVVEHVEGEALPMVSLEARLEEVVSPLEEIPSMIQLDTLQLGEFVPFIFGAESIIGGCCREDGNHANGTGDEPDIIASEGIQDSRVDDGHKMGHWKMERRAMKLYLTLERQESIYSGLASSGSVEEGSSILSQLFPFFRRLRHNRPPFYSRGRTRGPKRNRVMVYDFVH